MFPKDFLWGAASAAYQVEGAYNQEGKGVSIWDTWVEIEGKTFEGTNGKIATDHYHRYKEDVAFMAKMGLKAYRFSIAWTRIFPEGKGKTNPQGIQFYHNLLDELHKHGITPLVTIYHWDLPQALQDEYEGWESRQIIDDFVNYAEFLFEEYGSKVKHWIVMNEPNIFTELGYLLAYHPPGKTDQGLFLKTFHHTALAHAKTIKLFKEKGYLGEIGSSIAYYNGYARTNDPLDLEARQNFYNTTQNFYMDAYFNGGYPERGLEIFKEQGVELEVTPEDIELMQYGKQADFIGINYYQSSMLAHNPKDGVGRGKMNTEGKKTDQQDSGIPGLYKIVKNANVEYTDWDWAIDPAGLTQSLVELTERFHKPMIVSENGLGAFDKVEDGKIHDDYRIKYLRDHIEACQKAIEQGVELFSYCVWSFTDILSWLNGYQKRYGLVYVDFDDEALPRKEKDSFEFYKNVIEKNGL